MDILAWLASLWDTLCGWFTGGDGEEGKDVSSTLGQVDINEPLLADDSFALSDDSLPDSADDWISQEAVPDSGADKRTSAVRDLTEADPTTSSTNGSVGGAASPSPDWTDIFKNWSGKDVGIAATGVGTGVAIGKADPDKGLPSWLLLGGAALLAFILLKE